MTDHSIRLLQKMLSLLEDYQTGRLGLRHLVDGLEGSFNALNEKLPDGFYIDWHLYWDRLEEKLALSSDEPQGEELYRTKALDLVAEFKPKLAQLLSTDSSRTDLP